MKMNRTLAIFTAIALLAVTVILAGSIPGKFTAIPPTPTPTPTPTPELAFGTIMNTEEIVVFRDDAVPFTEAGDMQNIAWEEPDTLRIGAAYGGTYRVTYEINVANYLSEDDVIDSFIVEVNGERIADTAASIPAPLGIPITLYKSTDIPIPPGASVRLINTNTGWPAELINVVDLHSVPSATFTLERVGD